MMKMAITFDAYATRPLAARDERSGHRAATSAGKSYYTATGAERFLKPSGELIFIRGASW
jgi:hypothetical protein